jgi:hypothetical protein
MTSERDALTDEVVLAAAKNSRSHHFRPNPEAQHSLGFFVFRRLHDCPSEANKTTKQKNKTMSPRNSEMLINEVYPRLRKAARSIPKIGHEDDEEIVQDCTLMAARMMESAELAGHPITAGNASYFAVKAAKSGRRSYYTGRSDVMHPGCQIDGKARFEWLDGEVEFETGDVGTLHDVVATYGYQGQEPDPAEEAARNLDWSAFIASHPERYRMAISVLLEGGTMRDAGKVCGLKDSAAMNLRRRIAADLIEFFGEDVIRRLLDGTRPEWESDLRMARERTHQSHEDSFRPQP